MGRYHRAACGAAPPEAGSSSAAISRTIVILNPNGAPTVKQDVITVEEQQKEMAAREALLAARKEGRPPTEEISLDFTCAGSSLWIFDNAARPGARRHGTATRSALTATARAAAWI